ncbi:hypothetical protein EST38_g6213 [Candolleomyces aberdarensis]|uniref:Metaxin glutathione S-transferase domain-containing protein n=1 Tax=Candolleomyces aberdarensis TaxID=2316362 RepID=A0A4Q2DKA7_9AGAR|nr:hypothetical protein EST38_g6213 [Candolleomyces aberdarensis]
MPIPHPLASFFSYFPLHTYPPIQPRNSPKNVERPTLWMAPPLPSSSPSSPSEDGILSSDVECLKWQAYIALRGVSNVKVRWDVAPEGALEGRLPNLQLPKADADKLNADLNPPTEEKLKPTPDHQLNLYSAHLIPSWVDLSLEVDSASDTLEGYKDTASRDESRAWVALLEGDVHAALIISQPQSASLLHLLGFGYSSPSQAGSKSASPALQTILSPPPAPLSGFTSLLPSFGARVNYASVNSQYIEAIASLSERLGTDQWFLGSSQPTPLDALAFAYLHCILVHAKGPVRVEVTKRVNLVAWEWRVRSLVRRSFST